MPGRFLQFRLELDIPSHSVSPRDQTIRFQDMLHSLRLRGSVLAAVLALCQGGALAQSGDGEVEQPGRLSREKAVSEAGTQDRIQQERERSEKEKYSDDKRIENEQLRIENELSRMQKERERAEAERVRDTNQSRLEREQSRRERERSRAERERQRFESERD